MKLEQSVSLGPEPADFLDEFADCFRLHAVDSESNPKCKRGASLLSSLTLRVTMKCAIFDRVQYNSPAVDCCVVNVSISRCSKQFQNSKFRYSWWHRRPAGAVNELFSLPPARRRCHCG